MTRKTLSSCLNGTRPRGCDRPSGCEMLSKPLCIPPRVPTTFRFSASPSRQNIPRARPDRAPVRLRRLRPHPPHRGREGRGGRIPRPPLPRLRARLHQRHRLRQFPLASIADASADRSRGEGSGRVAPVAPRGDGADGLVLARPLPHARRSGSQSLARGPRPPGRGRPRRLRHAQDADILAFLLELNQQCAAREFTGHPITPPGLPLPPEMRAAFVTEDCIRA